jgi:uncharacterized OB-fold protein
MSDLDPRALEAADDRLHFWDYHERLKQPSVIGMRCLVCGKRQFEAARSCPGEAAQDPRP